MRAKFVFAAALLLTLPSIARAQASCEALPEPSARVIDVTPSEVASLQAILDSARPGDTIALADGLYSLQQTLVLRTPRVTLRSKSGNRGGVFLDGRYVVRDLILVQESDVTIADLTLTRSYWHLVHVVPDRASITNVVLHNLHGIDGGQQFIKVNQGSGTFADAGVIRCSVFEMTDAGRANVRDNCYTGGIDIHQARGWHIYANRFSGFWCGSGLSEHAIHAWTGSRDTLVERNVIVNSARGIGFGLGGAPQGRTYEDRACPETDMAGHYGGAIINNFVMADDPRLFASSAGFDTGIGIEQACNAAILHNTVASTVAPRSSSIEWRFARTSAIVANNLVSHRLVPRDNARGTLSGNVTNAPLTLFVDVAAGNLRLLPSATAAIDKAAPLDQPVPYDIDGEPRGVAADVGADEYLPAKAETVRRYR